MKLKDVIVAILLAFGVGGFVLAILLTQNYFPVWFSWVLSIAGVIIWAVYLVITFRDRRAKRDYPAIWTRLPDHNGIERWTAMDGSGRTRPLNSPPPEVTYARNKEVDPR